MESLATKLVDSLRGPGVFLFRLLLSSLISDLPFQFQDPVSLSSYDFVVVGSGSAGGVVAARLAESGASVLVLEAGRSPPPESMVPGFMPFMVGGDVDWDIRLAPQKRSQWGFHQNASILAMGKTVGGGSTVGGTVYGRGSRHDYDHWASLGNPGWDYDSVLPFFKASETFVGVTSKSAARYHGTNGPIRVASNPSSTRVGKAFLKAGQELGYDIIDENADGEVGFSPVHFTVFKGEREDVSERYLRPLAHLHNLHILTNAFVTKIILKEGRAVGVQYQRGKHRSNVFVRNEVIVCAGAINTPKLLMLSGIGPKGHLNRHKIRTTVPLEGVGRNLKDHHAVMNFPYATKAGSAFSLSRFATLGNLKEYLKRRTGEFSKQFGEDGAAWVKLGNDRGPKDWPDVQVSLLNLAISSFGQLAVTYSSALKPEVYQDIMGPLEGIEACSLMPMLSRPKSSGTVSLKSNNPYDDPIVDFNFLDHPDDVKLLIKGVRFAQSIASSQAMAKGVEATYRSKKLRFCSHFPNNSDQYWECYIRHLVTSFWHPAGSCKMGPKTDPLAVVDARLRVYGTKNLRVADASIMPQVPTANTMAASLMVGEKAAHMLLQDWNLV